MSKPVIVLAREFPPAILQFLGQIGEVRIYNSQHEAESLADATIWVGTAVDPIRQDLIQRLPGSLKLIANLGVGTDNIDLAAAAARGIHCSNTPVVTTDTADLTWALLLAASRRLSSAERLLRAGDWNAGAAQIGQRVHGKTLGIIGFGAIGQAVARRATGFDMPIIYHGPNPKPDAAAAVGAEYRATLSELLSEADIVCLNCPLTPATRHLLNATTLSQIKPGAIIINTGRGPLIHEAALVEALKSGHIGAAGLDVFEFEPEVTAELKTFDNVTLLPHIGSATQECRTDIVLRLVQNIQAFLQTGRPVDNCPA